jgi:hypothetical protein
MEAITTFKVEAHQQVSQLGEAQLSRAKYLLQ